MNILDFVNKLYFLENEITIIKRYKDLISTIKSEIIEFINNEREKFIDLNIEKLKFDLEKYARGLKLITVDQKENHYKIIYSTLDIIEFKLSPNNLELSYIGKKDIFEIVYKTELPNIELTSLENCMKYEKELNNIQRNLSPYSLSNKSLIFKKDNLTLNLLSELLFYHFTKTDKFIKDLETHLKQNL